MKKTLKITILTLLVLCTSILFIGCSSKKTEKETNTETVDIVFSQNLFPGITDADVPELVKEEGIEQVKLNDDTTVTFSFTKSKLEELKESYLLAIQQLITEVPKDESISIKEIKNNEDYTEYTITVNSNELKTAESIIAVQLIDLSSYYASLLQNQDITVDIAFVNAENNEVIDVLSSTDTQRIEEIYIAYTQEFLAEQTSNTETNSETSSNS